MLDELQVQFTLSQGWSSILVREWELNLIQSSVFSGSCLKGWNISTETILSIGMDWVAMELHKLKLDRDVKVQNILLNSKGVLKLGELSQTRLQNSPSAYSFL